MKLKIKEFDDVIKHIEAKAYKSAIVLLQAMEKDAKEDREEFISMSNELEMLYDDKAVEEEGENI